MAYPVADYPGAYPTGTMGDPVSIGELEASLGVPPGGYYVSGAAIAAFQAGREVPETYPVIQRARAAGAPLVAAAPVSQWGQRKPYQPILAGARPVETISGIPMTPEPGDEIPPGVGVGGLAFPLAIPAAAAAIPAIGGIAASALGWLATKGLLQTLVKAGLAGGVASAAWQIIQNLFGLSPEEAVVAAGKKTRKRYSIGSNPRVRTLQKVSRHCQRLLKRHEKVIRQFLPKPARGMTAAALAKTYLSTAERKALKGG